MTQIPQKIAIPAAIADKLDDVRRRTLRVRLGTAIVAAIGVLLTAMAVAMLVDWLATIYDFRWRALLTYSAWTAAGATLIAWAVAAWRHTRRVEHVAAKVDQEIPELEERWSTVTELSNSNGAANGTGTVVHPAMFEQVSKEAQSWTPRVEPERVIPLDGLIRALLFLTAVTTVLGIAVIFDSQRTSVLLRRFWQPYTPISATELTDLSGNLVVGRGESLEIAANLVGTPVDEASLILQPEDGDPKTITIVPRGDGKDELAHRMRTVKEPMRYRLRAGDGQTPWYEIVVADRPQLGEVRVTLTPPAYTRKEPKVINKLPRRVTVLEGSSVEIALKPKQPLKSLTLKFSPELSEQLTAGEDGWYRWRSTLDKNIAFKTLLTEKHGLSNLRPPICEIKIRPDRPPVVKILTPNSEMAVRPDDTIPVTFVASDDVGVHQAELVVYDEGNMVDGKPAVLDRIPVPLGDQQGAVKVKATVKLDLSQYETTDGSQLSFSIRVREDRGQQFLASQNAATTTSPAARGQDQTSQQSDGTVATTASPANDDSTNQLAGAADLDGRTGEQQTSADANMREGQLAARDSADPSNVSENAENSAADNTNPGPLARLAQQATPMIGDAPTDSQTQPRTTAGDPQASAGQTSATNSKQSQSPSSGKSNQSQNQSAAGNTDKQSSGANSDAGGNRASDDQTGESPEKMDGESRTTSSSRQSLNTASDDDQQSENSSAPSGNSDTNDGEMQRDSESDTASSPDDQSGQPGGNQPQSSNANSNPGQQNGSQQPNAAQPNSSAEDDEMQSADRQPSGSNPSGSRSSSNSQNPQESQPQDGSPSPGNPMSKRELDVEAKAQSSSSQRLRLKIDEWAGSYDGQQRNKLEIAIAPKLEAVDRALEKAENLSRSVLDDVDAGKPWASKHDRDIQRADEQIEAAIKVIEDLENETYGTPYAFIGLQLVDIKQAHISLARRDFWKSLQTKDEVRVNSVRDGWQHTIRARELLVLLTERFERTKIEYKMADAVQNIKKMYQVYVEDSMELLRPPGDGGSRYNRKVAEFDLDDEYLERLKEVIEMRNDMREELARILADDPRLLRRFLDAQRNRQVVLRNELDRLIEDQSELNREVEAWAAAEDDERPALAKILIGRHVESAQDIAIAAANLHDRFETWSPLGKEVEDAEFQATAAVLQEIATATRELSNSGLDYVEESTRAKKIEDVSEGEDAEDAAGEEEVEENPFNPNEAVEQISLDAQNLYERFTRLEVLLRQVGGRNDSVEIASFATNRLLETRRLIEQTSAWIRQLKQQQAGNYHRAAEVAQYRLATKTDTMAGKLAGLEQTMAGLLQNDSNMLPKSIADKARGLLAALDEQAAPNQLAAVYALRRNQMSRATSREAAALAGLELAGQLYDEMVEAAIKELDKLPVQDPIAGLLDDPTLDELLRELEQEIPIEEALGIPARPSNLRIMSDWLRQGGDNALMTGGGRRMMQQMQRQQQMRQRQLENQYRRAVARALKEAEAEDLVKNMPKLARETTDWNRLASQLEDDLRQGRDKAPPERYRRAIEQYFRQVSGSQDAE